MPASFPLWLYHCNLPLTLMHFCEGFSPSHLTFMPQGKTAEVLYRLILGCERELIQRKGKPGAVFFETEEIIVFLNLAFNALCARNIFNVQKEIHKEFSHMENNVTVWISLSHNYEEVASYHLLGEKAKAFKGLFTIFLIYWMICPLILDIICELNLKL